MHALFGHILLRENNGNLFRTVVAVVEEDHRVAFFYSAVASRVHQRFHELIRIFMLLGVAIIATLNGCHHIVASKTFAVNQLIISHFDTFPTFVTVHGIETSDDRRNMRTILVTFFLKISHKTLTRTRISVAAVHETMHKRAVCHPVY